ncbi:MAG TPA: acyl-CoA dehydrogenase family protein [Bauldia sp.]|nr:acyl-CoA dehydrogenase family protein [Bauldia sp.]
MVSAADTHEVFNQTPPFAGLNLFTSDPALGALVEGLPQVVVDQLVEHGAQWGTPETFELGRIANVATPTLRSFDASGTRIDSLEFHPAYHALMRRSVAAGIQCSVWDASGEEASVRAVSRAARMYISAAVETGHLVPLAMTNAAVAALAHTPNLADVWLPRIRTRRYDSAQRPLTAKAAALVSLGFTEKQGGSDLSSITSAAVESSDGMWRVTGHKWFLSAPASDAYLVLAQTVEGLTCFLVPRYLNDGTLNGIRLMRLKDAMGQRSNAIGEIELDHAAAWLVGEFGGAAATIVDLQALMRLDAAVAAAGMMRLALAESVHHCRHRKAAGQSLIDQPLMTRVLADMALDTVAAAALAFRLAESYDRAGDDPAEAAFARLMTPAVKYWVTKVAPTMIGEAMEALGGNAYVEDSHLPRLYRDAPAQSMSEGTGNVMALEVMRVLRKSSEPLESVLANVEDALGNTAKSTLNVLRAATAVALADEGSARILTEQLAMTVAAAALRRRFPSVVADAFLETRLGKPWRATYGMLDSRFDARAFVNYLCPAD